MWMPGKKAREKMKNREKKGLRFGKPYDKIPFADYQRSNP